MNIQEARDILRVVDLSSMSDQQIAAFEAALNFIDEQIAPSEPDVFWCVIYGNSWTDRYEVVGGTESFTFTRARQIAADMNQKKKRSDDWYKAVTHRRAQELLSFNDQE